MARDEFEDPENALSEGDDDLGIRLTDLTIRSWPEFLRSVLEDGPEVETSE